MLTKLISASAIASILLLSGCKSGGNDNPTQNTAPVSDEVKTLAKSITLQGVFGDQLSSGKSNIQGRSLRDMQSFTQNCTNGGTMSIMNDFDPTMFDNDNFNFNNFTSTSTMRFDNCIEDGAVVNGAIEMTTNFIENTMKITMKYIEDLTFDDGKDKVKILKDSYMIDEMKDDNTFITTETITALFNDRQYKTKDLKSVMFFNNNNIGFYPLSGEEIIDGKTYRVDESYDASKTPMIIDQNDDLLKGGKFKYLDEANHPVTLEATDKNEITVSVDTDGDGQADQQEVIKL